MLSFVLVYSLIGVEAEPPALIGTPAAKVATCPCGPNCPCAKPAPPSIAPVAVEVKEKKNKTVVKTRTTSAAFEEVNAHRARLGLRPFAFNPGLTEAAEKCAAYRASIRHHGHVNDFAFIPAGVRCDATGAEAPGQSYNAPGSPGWYTCCTEDNYASAGAGSAIGPDGERYMSLFVSYAGPQGAEAAPAVASAPTCADGTCTVQPPPVQFVPQFQAFSFAPQNSCPNGNCGGSSGRRRR